MLPNVAATAAVILSSVDFAGGRNGIVLIEGEFPSVRYLIESLGPRLGARVRVVPSPRGRPGVGIRLSPHFYTDEAELERAFEVLDEIRSTGSWRRWRQSPVTVT